MIPVRTLAREFRVHLDCSHAARVMDYIRTDPSICGTTADVIDLTVERAGKFYRLALPDGSVVEGTAPHLLDAMHRVALAAFIEEVPGAPLIHAGGIRIDEVPLLLIGAKGAGKTTLTLHLIEQGYVVEGDEHVAARETDLIARPRTLRIKADSVRFAPTLAGRIRGAPFVKEWNDLPIYSVSPTIGGHPWRIATMRRPALVFLEPNYGGHSVAKPASVDRAFALLLARSLLPGEKAAAVARLRSVARGAQAWEMSLGDLDGAEMHLKRIARSVRNAH